MAAALWVLFRSTWQSFAAAFVVAAGGLFAVVLYRYVDVPSLGPIPRMYDPTWFTKKTESAGSQVLALLAAVIGAAGARPSQGLTGRSGRR